MGLAALLARNARSAAFRARVLAGGGRLPNALVLGAAKAGTSSLFAWLIQHPQVYGAPVKELRFFDRQWERGPRWYRAKFAPTPEHSVVLEATPAYLYEPKVPARVRALMPDCRLIVLLREPVARAWSHYNFRRAEGRETLSFAEALAREADRGHRFAYRGYSLYAPQIERWLALFPRSSFLFLKAETLFADPLSEFAKAAAFLELDPGAAINFAPRNRNPHPLRPDEAALLDGAFNASNARTKALTGISW